MARWHLVTDGEEQAYCTETDVRIPLDISQAERLVVALRADSCPRHRTTGNPRSQP